MGTYFGFSDECGDYKVGMTSRQLARHPFYIRSTVVINSEEWKKLSDDFKNLKRKYYIPLSKEFKWAYLWSLKYFETTGRPIPNKNEVKFFEKYGFKTMLSFVEEAMKLINGLSEKKIIVTYTNNSNSPRTNEKSMLSMHLQEHMQRIEMELAAINGENLAVLFFDPVSPEKNEYLRELYSELFESGDYVNYSHIKDSLNIENSHHSVGIQLADYISGAFSALLKSDSSGNYSDGIRMYFDSVHSNLRRNWDGGVQGYGIREVPKDTRNRGWLIKKIKSMKAINESL